MNEKSHGEVRTAALERGLRILAAFGSGRDSLSLAELAAQTGLYKSSILRYAASMIEIGFLQRLSDGRFRLGAAIFQLGRIYQRSFHLGDAVIPALRELVAATGESASFYVRDGADEICLHRLESPRPVRDAGISEGDRYPIDDSACSTVLSAFSGDDPGYDEARREVAILSRRGVRRAGVAAIACPVLTVENKLAGALLLSGPDIRFAGETVRALRLEVLRQAATLTRTLGGRTTIFERAIAADETTESVLAEGRNARG